MRVTPRRKTVYCLRILLLKTNLLIVLGPLFWLLKYISYEELKKVEWPNMRGSLQRDPVPHSDSFATAAAPTVCAGYKLPDGVLLFAFSSPGETEDNILKRVMVTVQSVSSVTAELPLALITDVNVPSRLHRAFYCVINLSDSVFSKMTASSLPRDKVTQLNDTKQAWGKAWPLLPFSPFQRTLAVLGDPAVISAHLNSSLLLSFLEDFDILIPPSNEFPHVTLDFVAFSRGSRFQTFFNTVDKVLSLGSVDIVVDLVARVLKSSSAHIGVTHPHPEDATPISYHLYSASHHQAYEDRLDRLHQQLQGRSYGASFFGYSTDPARLARYLKDVEKTAWGLKMFNPRIKTVLFTNQVMDPTPPFDDVVRMLDEDIKPACCKRNESWNILARVQYHQHSPYDLTVMIDSDRVVYDDISHIFELLAGKWDVLGVSGGNLPTVDLGVLGYKKGNRMLALFSAWAEKIKAMKHEGVDDQFSFRQVYRDIPGLEMGFLNPSWQMKYGPPKSLSHVVCNQQIMSVCNVTFTMIVNGPVKIAAGSYTSLNSLLARAHELNRDADTPRMYVRDLLRNKYIRVLSQEECDTATRGQCDHPEIDWSASGDDVLSSTQVRKKFPKVQWNVS